MAKTLNELARELKELIIDLQSDAHNTNSINNQRYNNLKLTMDIAKNPTPHVIINIAMSEAVFNLKTGDKDSGALGPDERYVIRWFGKISTLSDLQEIWKEKEKNRGKATADEDE